MSTRANQKMALLKADLKLEFPTFTISEGVVGAASNPYLVLSDDASPAIGEQVAYIKMIPRSYDGFPTASLASTDDGRSHILQVAVEAQNGHSSLSLWTAANLTKLIARLAHMNMEINVYLSANGVMPVDATVLDATKFIAEIRTDVRRQNSGD